MVERPVLKLGGLSVYVRKQFLKKGKFKIANDFASCLENKIEFRGHTLTLASLYTPIGHPSLFAQRDALYGPMDHNVGVKNLLAFGDLNVSINQIIFNKIKL